MPQAEFLLLMQICDCFDVVKLEKAFVAEHKAAIAEHPLFDEEMVGRLNEGVEISEIEHLVNEEHAEGLYHNNKLVGCVKRAHDIDVNLSAHVMHENLVSKASSVLALLHAVKNAGIDKSEVEYVIDCCEEACGDRRPAQCYRFRYPRLLRRSCSRHCGGRLSGQGRHLQDRYRHRRRLHR